MRSQVTAPAPRPDRSGWRTRSTVGTILRYTLLLAGGALMVIPFLWMLTTSL